MAITDKKVSELYPGRDISSLSDRPNQDGMTGDELKARFDQLGKEVIPKHNDLIDELVVELANARSVYVGDTEPTEPKEVWIDTDEEYDVDVDFIQGIPAVEQARVNAEAQRIIDENLRLSQENTRVSNESTRGNNENTRQTQETSRNNAETLRASSEVTRGNNEVTRQSQEGTRVSQESGRVSAENIRVASENARNVFVAYNGATAYVVGNKVSYNGSSYVCILNSTGNLPTNTTYWLLIAQKGDNTTASAVTNTPSGNISSNTVQGAINELDTKKVDKVTGKGLSTNDYTTEEKSKVANLPDDTNAQLAEIENGTGINNGAIEPIKTSFFDNTNWLNQSDDNYLDGKAISGSTSKIVDNAGYALSGYINVDNALKLLLAINGSEIGNADLTYANFKIAYYNSEKIWLSTLIGYVAGGFSIPETATYARIQLLKSKGVNQINLDSIKPYRPYGYKVINTYLPNDDYGASLRWTSYGDSLTFRNNWQPWVLSKLSNLIHTNLGIGSTTMAYIGDREAQYPCFVNEARIQAIKDANPDILTVFGGTNDCHLYVPLGTDAQFTTALASKDKTTFKGAFSFLIETLLAWKPTLKIIVMTPIQGIYDNAKTANYKAFAEASKAVADFYSLNFVDFHGRSGISDITASTFLTSDQIHPNVLGGKRLANLMIPEFINLTRIL